MTTATITYRDELDNVTPQQLAGGFFVGWPQPPTPATHYQILLHSALIGLACSADGMVVGWITAISDGISCAYIPHLEVLPTYQGQGIGSELVRRLLIRLRHLYMVDLVCDPEVQPFYERLGFQPWSAMVLRNYDRQACTPLPIAMVGSQ